ncbi:Crp/Fnr family transcriptional regulator [Cohaesibacter celericrescens]|uniref:Crp/Fnr family transcriptional regulator n=1 Tax=Cohaesibacter celericrescens TaxID=2067669 RepID=UPI00356B0303
MDDNTAQKTLQRLDESLLTHCPPFSKLASSQIREILDLASCRRYNENVAVYDEGAFAERFYMLLDGYIRVVRITETGEQIIALHIPSGQLFGIAKALGRDTYPATAITASESLILSWPMSLWDTFTSSYEGFATETYKLVGNRVGEMNMRIVELATLQVEQRVANALLRLINQTGRKVEDGIEVDFPITRQDLSEMTATTLHTVSRLLSSWEKQGLIKSRRKAIIVSDPHRLMLRSQQL